ncbi:hypothetical protein [Proteiniphilum sp.]|uniref:hypothetical protein n=1 Tax=Proteiniphilum sp. TaxID=1926877 RepID=UPI00332ECFC4
MTGRVRRKGDRETGRSGERETGRTGDWENGGLGDRESETKNQHINNQPVIGN